MFKHDYKTRRVPNGRGLKVTKFGDIQFGYFKEGILHGYGRRVTSQPLTVYEGGFEEGKFNGQGKYLDVNGNEYEGKYALGKMHGKGKYTWAQKSGTDNICSWKGQFENDMMVGEGMFITMRFNG